MKIVPTWMMKINMGLLESYVAGFLPLKIPACATLVDVEFDDIFCLVLLRRWTGIMRQGKKKEIVARSDAAQVLVGVVGDEARFSSKIHTAPVAASIYNDSSIAHES